VLGLCFFVSVNTPSPYLLRVATHRAQLGRTHQKDFAVSANTELEATAVRAGREQKRTAARKEKRGAGKPEPLPTGAPPAPAATTSVKRSADSAGVSAGSGAKGGVEKKPRSALLVPRGASGGSSLVPRAARLGGAPSCPAARPGLGAKPVAAKPTTAMDSPGAAVKSPGVAVNSSGAAVKSPGAAVNSYGAAVNSPGVAVNSSGLGDAPAPGAVAAPTADGMLSNDAFRDMLTK